MNPICCEPSTVTMALRSLTVITSCASSHHLGLGVESSCNKGRHKHEGQGLSDVIARLEYILGVLQIRHHALRRRPCTWETHIEQN